MKLLVLRYVFAASTAATATAFRPIAAATTSARKVNSIQTLMTATSDLELPSSNDDNNNDNDDNLYIDQDRRNVLNTIVLGSVAVSVGGIGFPYVTFFVPPGAGSGNGNAPVAAKDVLGQDVYEKAYLETKDANDRSLVQGLRGDPTYLIVKEDHTLEDYALNAICTHLGCVVPWNAAENKFICPCHGSQYDPDGSVVRGPAPLPFALAHRDTDANGKIVLTDWTEEDFRTGTHPWWA